MAAAQGVLLKAAAAGSCLSLGWPLPGLAHSSLWLHFFFSVKTRGEVYLDPLVCPGLSREQGRRPGESGSLRLVGHLYLPYPVFPGADGGVLQPLAWEGPGGRFRVGLSLCPLLGAAGPGAHGMPGQ